MIMSSEGNDRSLANIILGSGIQGHGSAPEPQPKAVPDPTTAMHHAAAEMMMAIQNGDHVALSNAMAAHHEIWHSTQDYDADGDSY